MSRLRHTSLRAWGQGLTVGALAFLAPGVAYAHDVLLFPPPWVMEDGLGDPQKVAPCGVDSTVSATMSNIVTTFAPGETITLRWQETIAHDGWFRIALSYDNRADLKDPPYSADAFGNSTDAGIENPPVAPVLVDNLFPHTAASITTPKTYTYNLKLPSTPCTKCTLQLVQFIDHHPYNMPGGYFYHHCADIAIVVGADGGNGTGGFEGGVDDASTGGSSGGSSGGSTSSGAGTSSSSSSSGAGSSSGSSGAGTSSGATGDDAGGDNTVSNAPVESSGSSGGCTASGHAAPAALSAGGLLGLAGLAGLFGRRRSRRG